MDGIKRTPNRPSVSRAPELPYKRRPLPRTGSRLISDFSTAQPKLQQQTTKLTIENGVIRPVYTEIKVKKPAEIEDEKPVAASSAILAAVSQSKVKASRKRRLKLQYAFVLAAVAMVGFGTYISIVGLQANKTAVAQAQKLTEQANTKSDYRKTLNTTKPTAYQLSDYVVAPDLPRYLNISKINVHARILSVGLTSTGALGTPDDIYDTAWYNESAAPGANGAMLIDGHLDGYNAAGVFWNLHNLSKGDKIQVVRGDGKSFTYQVVKTESFSTGKLNMQTAMTSVSPSKPGLNLITCDGDYIPGSGYNKRTIVFAELN